MNGSLVREEERKRVEVAGPPGAPQKRRRRRPPRCPGERAGHRASTFCSQEPAVPDPPSAPQPAHSGPRDPCQPPACPPAPTAGLCALRVGPVPTKIPPRAMLGVVTGSAGSGHTLPGAAGPRVSLHPGPSTCTAGAPAPSQDRVAHLAEASRAAHWACSDRDALCLPLRSDAGKDRAAAWLPSPCPPCD